MSAALYAAAAAVMVSVAGATVTVWLVQEMTAAEIEQRIQERFRIMITVSTRFGERLAQAAAAVRALAPDYGALRAALGGRISAAAFDLGAHSVQEAEAETRPWLYTVPFSMDDVRGRVADLWTRAIARGARNPTTRDLYAQARHELSWEHCHGRGYDPTQSAADMGDTRAVWELELRHALLYAPAHLAALQKEAIRLSQERLSQTLSGWEWVGNGILPVDFKHWRCTQCGTVREAIPGVEPGGCCMEDGEEVVPF